MRKYLLCLFLFALAPCAQAVTLAFPGGATINIDGRWYVMLAGNLIVEPGQGYALQAPVSMNQCGRANGQAVQVTNRLLRFNNPVDVIYLTLASNPDGSSGAQILYPFDRPLLRFRSSTGDIVCQGEVPAPPGLDTLFRSGFE